MTPPPDLIELFVRPLERVGVEYMITGGVAAVIYGDPRFTRDVDLVLELDPDGSLDLLAAFDPGEFYLPPAEVVSEEARRSEGGHFNIIHHDSALRADVYTAGEVVLHRWALDRVVRLRVGRGDIGDAAESVCGAGALRPDVSGGGGAGAAGAGGEVAATDPSQLVREHAEWGLASPQ